MIRIFILEDSPERIAAMEHALKMYAGGPHEVTIRKWLGGPDGAVEAFTPSYDLILLDHDLGGEQMVDAREENTGSAFTRFLATTTQARNACVIIHSYNPEGAQEMELTLKKAGFVNVQREPFSRTLLSFLDSISQVAA